MFLFEKINGEGKFWNFVFRERGWWFVILICVRIYKVLVLMIVESVNRI